MFCFSCNTEIQIKEKVFFRDRCPSCDAAQHVCRNCSFYDPAAYNKCRENKAERVVEKERENRWPSAGAVRTEVDAILAGRIRVQCPTTMTKRAIYSAGRVLDRNFYLGFSLVVVFVIATALNMIHLLTTLF